MPRAGYQPVPLVIPALVILFVSPISWLEGVTLHAICLYVEPSGPHTFQAAPVARLDFRPTKTEDRPTDEASLFAKIARLSPLQFHSRHRLWRYLPASPCGPFVVELFPIGALRRFPDASPSGSRGHPRAWSLRWQTLNAPLGSRTPLVDYGKELIPFTTLRNDGSGLKGPKLVCIAPLQRGTTHRIEIQDSSCLGSLQIQNADLPQGLL